ncbi:MAG: cell division protein FtsA [Acidobacteriia bacterium]|nr:cell division protein FtsA [Terriglobia bacterium]
MARKDQYIFGLDLGTTKTCALACQRNNEGKLEVAGLGVAESRGWRKGVIVNLNSAMLAIKKAVEAAEAESKASFEWAYLGVGGTHIRGVNSRGALSLGAHTREVTFEDKIKAFQIAKGITLPPDRELIDALRQEYLLDSQNGIRDPLGMTGKTLEVNVHLVTAARTAWQSIVTAANSAGIKVPDSGTIFEPLASAWACVSEDERELGVALLDIGGGSSELIVFHEGAVRYSSVLAIAGEHFTNELVELLQQDLARFGMDKQLGAGLVLTGGGAKLGGLLPLTEQALGMPVRLGRPSGLEKMGSILSDPVYATVVGLVTYGYRLRLLQESNEKGWWGRLWGGLRGKNS